MMRFYFVIVLFLSHLTQAQFFAPAYPNAITKNNLIVDYDFTNPISYAGTGTSVASANGTNLPATMYNSPVFYKDPGYLKFTAASGHYLMMGDFKNYYPPVTASTRTGVFTISLWFNPTATNGVVLSDLNSTAISANYHTTDIEMVNGYLKFSVWPKSGIITTSTTVALNTWHHVVLTYTGNSVAAYLDGALINTSTYNRDGPAMSSLTNSQYFAVAGADSTNMGSGAYGSFLLGDVKYFATALSATEVSRLYLDEAPEYDLVLMLDASTNYLSYPGSGTTWNDISGATKTATNAAGVSYKTSGGGMMYYNGTTTGYTDFSFNLDTSTTFSFEMWLYPTSLSNSMFFGFNLYDVWANTGALGFNSSMGDQYGLTATQVTNLGLLNKWNHYVFVMNSGNYLLNKIYINGVSQPLSQIQGTQNTSLVNFNNGVGRLGSWINNSNFMQNMYLSKFKVYRRELTQKEITANYNNSVPVVIAADGLTEATASTSAYQIKQDYSASTDGFYWIKNTNINGGVPFKIYADMTTDGGGWTLIMKNSSYAGWNYANSIALNTTIPFTTNAQVITTSSSNYSIIGWADYIKKSTSGFQYMIDAGSRNSFGGIWTANSTYSFVSTSNGQTNLTENKKFGTWNYVGSNNGMALRMPWRSTTAGGGNGVLTLSDGTGNWWGTLISLDSYYSPAPWISDAGGGTANQQPGIIWYWVR